MISRIISGGQTGADRGGLDAAIELGVSHGGFCPKGRLSENGPIPDKYHLEEAPTDRLSERTEMNVLGADGTIVFTATKKLTPGSLLTVNLCERHRKPCLRISQKAGLIPGLQVASIRRWIEQEHVVVLNVAGSRESKAPGIAEFTRKILIAALR